MDEKNVNSLLFDISEEQEKLAEMKESLTELVSRRGDLYEQIAQLQEQIAQLDDEIDAEVSRYSSAVSTISTTSKPKKRQAAKKAKTSDSKDVKDQPLGRRLSLADLLVWLMGYSKLRNPKDLSEAALELGFETRSKKFQSVVSQCLNQHKFFVKNLDGIWVLSKPGTCKYATQRRWGF